MKLKKTLIILVVLFCANFSVEAANIQIEKNYGINTSRGNSYPIGIGANRYKIGGNIYSTFRSKKAKGFKQIGMASYYHNRLHGHRTSSGELYNKTKFTAAHKTLPLNSYVLVTNLRNGREVIVRINDRGPFISKRVIDLSFAAAKKLGFIKSGVIKVKIEALYVVKNKRILHKSRKDLIRVTKNKTVRNNVGKVVHRQQSMLKN